MRKQSQEPVPCPVFRGHMVARTWVSVWSWAEGSSLCTRSGTRKVSPLSAVFREMHAVLLFSLYAYHWLWSSFLLSLRGLQWFPNISKTITSTKIARLETVSMGGSGSQRNRHFFSPSTFHRDPACETLYFYSVIQRAFVSSNFYDKYCVTDWGYSWIKYHPSWGA